MLFSENHGFEYRSSTTFPPPVATGNTDNNRTFTGINLDETHVISPTAVLDIARQLVPVRAVDAAATPRRRRPSRRLPSA